MAKSIEGWVTGRVRDQVEVELQSVEQLTFGEFVLALPSPCASYIVDVPEAGLQGVIDIGHEFAYFVVDRLLGGVGDAPVPSRTLTPLERMVVRIVADRSATFLSEAWKDYVRLDLEISGFESIPEMLRVANREDPVLVANLVVKTMNMSSLMMLCLPFSALEKFFTGSGERKPDQPQGSPEERRHDRELLEATLMGSQVMMRARWPDFTASLRQLAQLRPGDILPTGLTPGTEMEILVADQRRFVGMPGKVGRNCAVRIMDHARPEPENVIDVSREEAFALA